MKRIVEVLKSALDEVKSKIFIYRKKLENHVKIM